MSCQAKLHCSATSLSSVQTQVSTSFMACCGLSTTFLLVMKQVHDRQHEYSVFCILIASHYWMLVSVNVSGETKTEADIKVWVCHKPLSLSTVVPKTHGYHVGSNGVIIIYYSMLQKWQPSATEHFYWFYG